MSALAFGQQLPSSTATEPLSLAFLMRALLLKIRTAEPVEVIAVHGGGLGPIGEVDVRPMVAQQDGIGTTVPHGVLYGLPYIRWQAGSSGLILDPVAGDQGLACFCSRDISAWKMTRKPSPPGSRRTYNLADGIYVGVCVSAAALEQYAQFLPNAAGINVVSPANIVINGVTFTPAGEVIDGNGVVLGTHGHTGVQSGTDISGPPVPG